MSNYTKMLRSSMSPLTSYLHEHPIREQIVLDRWVSVNPYCFPDQIHRYLHLFLKFSQVAWCWIHGTDVFGELCILDLMCAGWLNSGVICVVEKLVDVTSTMCNSGGLVTNGVCLGIGCWSPAVPWLWCHKSGFPKPCCHPSSSPYCFTLF